MANVGYATLPVIPVLKGFGAKLAQQATGESVKAGKQIGSDMGSGVLAASKKFAAPLAAVFGGLAIGKVAEDSVKLQAQFSQTMNTMAAVADVPAAGIKNLSALAVKMGADTVFSANDAADAMLELAKGGISAADIQAGALSGTLTLAAAGGTDLATAATIASNAMNTFGLKGRDMNAVAAALAGGANASSASVESLGEALGQVGPGAKNAGLSLQETVAVLSSFDAAGIKGSDAGTSLKTMLSNLVPQTKAAKNEMADLGLKFTDAKGNFIDITQVAEQLKDKLGGLSEAQRTQALNTIFGSDASRAATVLMNEGAAGLEKYIKATNDSSAAQRVAAARMQGTAGAIEQMKGSLETAELSVGQFLAPAVTEAAKDLADGFNGVSNALNGLHAGPALGDAMVAASGLAVALTAASVAGKAYATVLGVVKGATKLFTAAQVEEDAAMDANPIGAVILALAALAAAVIAVIKYHKQIAAVFVAAWHGIESAAKAVGAWFSGPFLAPFKAVGAWFSGPFLAPFKAIPAFFTGPFLSPFKAIGGFFSGPFLAPFKAVGAWFEGPFTDFFTKTIPNAVGAVGHFFQSLPGMVGAALAALPNLTRKLLEEMAYWVGYGIGKAVKFLIDAPPQIWAAVTSMWSGAVTRTAAGVSAVLAWVTSFVQQADAFVAALPSRVWAALTSMWNGAVSLTVSGANATIALVNNFVTQAAAFVAALPGRIWADITSLWSTAVTLTAQGATAAINWYVTFSRSAVSWVEQLPGQIWGVLTSLWSRATSIVSSGVSATVNFIAQLPGRAYSVASSLPGKIWDALSAAVSDATSIGRNIVQGVINGIEDEASRLLDLVKDLAGQITRGFKDAMGIHSPSKVFHGLGGYIAQGLALGIQSGAPRVLKATRALMGIPASASARAPVVGSLPETAGASGVSRIGAALNIEHYHESAGSARGTAEELMLLMTARGY